MATRTVLVEPKSMIIYSCDYCGKDRGDMGRRICNCVICGKHVCTECDIWSDYESLEDGCYSGDYPDHFCRSCWDKGEGIRKRIHAIRQDALVEEESVFQSWKDLCMEGATLEEV